MEVFMDSLVSESYNEVTNEVNSTLYKIPSDEINLFYQMSVH